MMQADEELRAAAQVESLLLTRTSQIVAELHDWVRLCAVFNAHHCQQPTVTSDLL